MKIDERVEKKYRRAIEEAFETILAKGNETHRRTARLILDSEMRVFVAPVSRVKASGISGVISASDTNERIASERLSVKDALGEIFITVAEETLNSQRGAEGTFVHENQHALDFAMVIESFSNADLNPLSLYDPTLYELEWAAHVVSGEYMLQIGQDEYLDEGLSLMILGRSETGCFVDRDGIRQRLKENYGLEIGGNVGKLASELAGLEQR
jgi:hypothetical protein